MLCNASRDNKDAKELEVFNWSCAAVDFVEKVDLLFNLCLCLCLCSLPVQVQCPVLRLPHLSPAYSTVCRAHKHNNAG